MLPPSLLLWIFKIYLHCNSNPRVVNGLPGVFASMAKGGSYDLGTFSICHHLRFFLQLYNQIMKSWTKTGR